MPITLYTGLPGHGKTSLMVEELLKQAKEGKRPIFASGIDGLEPGLATVIDVTKWNDRNLLGEHVVPDGALIFVDEAWKNFGHLQNASAQRSTPDHVLALAEHRHRGIDFVWTTQDPSQIYPFARKMIQDHHHVVRRFGTKFLDVFSWAELNEETKSSGKRESALRTTRSLPETAWKSYKSASEHTIKRKIPFRVLALPAVAILAVCLIVGAIHYVRSIPAKHGATQEGEVSASADSRPTGTHGATAYATAADYALAQTPRIASIPSSAPLYDGQQVTGHPIAMCMSTADSCRCMTEQGTRYYVVEKTCRDLARNGPAYDPFKPQVQPQAQGMEGDVSAGRPQVAAMAPDGAAVAAKGTPTPEGTVAGYGQMGHGANNAPL